MPFDGFEYRKIDTDGARIHVAIGGAGPALLLLHGYPQTHLMWRKIVHQLTEKYTVICPDLRGYGESSALFTLEKQETYSKRQMAFDQIQVANVLGFQKLFVAGHDRGARVAHRMALDHPNIVQKVALLDIVPTRTVYLSADWEVASAYYHWFFLIQPTPLPERLIEGNATFFFSNCIDRWIGKRDAIDDAAYNEYLEAFRRPEVIHATCEDYRAGATIDLAHDEADLSNKVRCPMLVLWSRNGFNHRKFDVLATWRERSVQVAGRAIPECGHFLPEEQPDAILNEFLCFFR